MSKKQSKKDYLRKKAIKQKANQKAATEKTGKFTTKRQRSIERDILLHQLFDFAEHTR